MDLRTLPEGLSPAERCNTRRKRVEEETGAELNTLHTDDERIGEADEKNCEQMLGTVAVPVGYAGPLLCHFSSKEERTLHVPLATTEAALVASVNRGCKALTQSLGVHTHSERKGTSRSVAFHTSDTSGLVRMLNEKQTEWTQIAEGTSNHLRVLSFTVEEKDAYVFLTFFANTDEAMGMNMVTIAATAIAEWAENQAEGVRCITVAANVDSDKKPSERVHREGRGFIASAEARIPFSVLESVLKTTAPAMVQVAHAKLDVGSSLAGAIGHNLHVANVVAALYLATGQDAAHVVEGSLADTSVSLEEDCLVLRVDLPALLVGVRGGGTALPAQHQCLQLLMGKKTALHPSSQLAESIAAAVLAGELSLLAAQSVHQLAEAHRRLARGKN